jgi:flavin-dependent dehydrogenase
VAIAGAGPAGCAMAIALAHHAPALRVCLATSTDRQAPRLGETVPPPIRPFLQHLGLWQRFLQDGHDPAHRSLSAWGAPVLVGTEFMLHVHQIGWRLDRCRFDCMMRDAAAQVACVLPAAITSAEHDLRGWVLRTGNDTLRAPILVDATGRAARVSRWLGAGVADIDRLIGCFVTLPDGGVAMQETLIEAVPDGWWFATRLPDGRRVLGCMTDADIVRRLRLRHVDGWLDALGVTNFARLHWSGERSIDQPRMLAAGSRLFRNIIQQPFIAVGDALSCFDPISGQGIVKALRSGIFAAYAAADWLRGDATGLIRYQELAAQEFAGYRRTLRGYYREETRWANAPFWQRRHAGP